MKTIDTAFRQVRMFSLVVVVICALVSIYVTYRSYALVSAVQSRIYILANGKALEAYSAERRDNIPVEARDHVKMFHHYFFSLDPDDKVITAHVAKALYLADASAKQQYDNLRENGYYTNVVSGNVSQEIETDSVVVDVDSYPYYFRYCGRQKITRPMTVVTRSLVTEGYLRTVSRSDNNPHGFLIEKWRTVENRDVEVRQRRS